MKEINSPLRVILGVGNPGRKYNNTKHNVGFIILDKIAERFGLIFKASKGEYYEAGSSVGSSRFLLIKPTTYVNLSGIAAKDIIDRYSLNLEDLLIITDDLNLELSKVRVRKSGGDGGHNGLGSIIYHLQSDKFPRIRFGIGSNFENGQMADYVLSKFNEKSLILCEKSFEFSVDLVENFILGGTKHMLDYFSKNSTKINLNSQMEGQQ